MSKTKKILIGIVLLTVVLLGIGYAAIQNVTLNIAGTATADPSQSNFIVRFTGTPEVSDSDKVAAAITDDTNATINVDGLTASGEIVTATYTVQNVSTDLSADLTVEATNSNEEYFVLDADLAKTSLVAGEATTLTVTVELIKTPISTEETSTIGIQLTATPVQPGEEGTTNSGSGTGGATGSATLNEYGFYYGVPYSITEGNTKVSFVFFEDGSVFYYENEIKLNEFPKATCTYAEKSITLLDVPIQVFSDGTEIGDGKDTAVAELGITILACGVWGHSENDGLNHTLVGCDGGHYVCQDACGTWEIPTGSTYIMAAAVEGDKTTYTAGEYLPPCYKSQQGDKFFFGDYEYRYGEKFYNDEWEATSEEWNVRVVDNTKTEYGEILPNINNEQLRDLCYTFVDCTSMSTAPIIPEGITWMFATFQGCTALIMPPEIPSSVQVMSWTFSNTSLTTIPRLSNNVVSMVGTFQGCKDLRTYEGSVDADGDFSDLVLPNNLDQMYSTFSWCSSMIIAPNIPDSVTDMQSTFSGCTNLKSYSGSTDSDGDFSGYILPSGLENMQATFSSCTAMTAAPVIPANVTDMYGTFNGCTSLTGTIQINTDKITKNNSAMIEDNNGYQCFYGTTKPIVLKGTGNNQTTLQLLASTANNGNVTIE